MDKLFLIVVIVILVSLIATYSNFIRPYILYQCDEEMGCKAYKTYHSMTECTNNIIQKNSYCSPIIH